MNVNLRKFRLIAALAAIVLLSFKSTQANAESTNLLLNVSIDGLPTNEKIGKNQFKWQSVCPIFSKFLIKNQGLWGTGPFHDYKCAAVDQKGKSAKVPGWNLIIRGDNKSKVFEIVYISKKGESSLRTSYTVSSEVGALTLMAKKDSNALIAYYISMGMPFRSTIPAKTAKSGKFSIKGPIGLLKNLAPPDELTLFSGALVDDVFEAKPIGKLTLKGENNGQVAWESPALSEEERDRDDDYFFVQQIKGRENILAQTDQIIKNDINGFFDKFLNIGRSAYIGGRYGIPLGGNGVLKKAPLIGLFLEFKSGIIDGFKATYDVIPVQVYEDGLGKTTFSWSRFQMGYAFSKSVENPIINWIDVAPRLGVTTLNLQYINADADTSPYEFKLSRAPTVGLEIGAENRNNFIRARLWAFGSYSIGILPIDRNHSTTSIRAGFDLYRQIVSFKSTTLAVLGFTAADQTVITRKTTVEDAESDTQIVGQIIYKSAYLGGGLTLTW